MYLWIIFSFPIVETKYPSDHIPSTPSTLFSSIQTVFQQPSACRFDCSHNLTLSFFFGELIAACVYDPHHDSFPLFLFLADFLLHLIHNDFQVFKTSFVKDLSSVFTY